MGESAGGTTSNDLMCYLMFSLMELSVLVLTANTLTHIVWLTKYLTNLFAIGLLGKLPLASTKHKSLILTGISRPALVLWDSFSCTCFPGIPLIEDMFKSFNNFLGVFCV